MDKSKISNNFREKVIKILYDFKEILAEISILNYRLKDLKHMLTLDNLADRFIPRNSTGYYNNLNCVEREVENMLFGKKYKDEKVREGIKEDIRNVENEIFVKNRIVEYVKIALSILDKKEEYLIKLVYFDKYKWKDIVINFNDFLAKKRSCAVDIRTAMIWKDKALNKMCRVLYGVEVIMLY